MNLCLKPSSMETRGVACGQGEGAVGVGVGGLMALALRWTGALPSGFSWTSAMVWWFAHEEQGSECELGVTEEQPGDDLPTRIMGIYLWIGYVMYPILVTCSVRRRSMNGLHASMPLLGRCLCLADALLGHICLAWPDALSACPTLSSHTIITIAACACTSMYVANS